MAGPWRERTGTSVSKEGRGLESAASHSVRLQTRKKDTYSSSRVAEGLRRAVPSSRPSLSLDRGWASEGEDGHPRQQGGLLPGHGKVRPLDGSRQGGSRAMTTRQRTAWAQVCHLWGNGGMVEGRGRLCITWQGGKKENMPQSDATCTWI
jgi:hypothetical protein